MKKFKVTITETLQQVITVTAIDPCEAEEKVEAEWNNQDHILDADNFVGVEFTAVPVMMRVMMRVMTMVHKDWSVILAESASPRVGLVKRYPAPRTATR